MKLVFLNLGLVRSDLFQIKLVLLNLGNLGLAPLELWLALLHRVRIRARVRTRIVRGRARIGVMVKAKVRIRDNHRRGLHRNCDQMTHPILLLSSLLRSVLIYDATFFF